MNRISTVCGLDEAGRGALAGPILAAAIVLPVGYPVERIERVSGSPLRDGKTLSPTRRIAVASALRKLGLTYHISSVGVDAINARGIGWANREVFRRLIEAVSADTYIVDGNLRLDTHFNLGSRIVRSVVKADASIPAVMLAGIVAKVERDSQMQRIHQMHPEYGWNRNVGYGTRTHLQALRQYGAGTHHRSTFVRTAISNAWL